MKQTKTSIALASAVILAVGTQFASAVPTAAMRISDGITTLIIHDEGAGDFYPGVGGVTFIGAIGGWKINVDTGITKPELGTATAPYMDFNFQATSKLTVPGTLTIEFSDTGFGPLSPNAGGWTRLSFASPGNYPPCSEAV